MLTEAPARPEHAALLLASLPPERRRRIQLRSNGSALEALVADIAASDLSYCGIVRGARLPDDVRGARLPDDDGDHVVTLGGVMPTGQPECGYVWQVISDVRAHKRAYLLQGREMQARFHRLYRWLVIAVEPENAAALRHLRRLGWREIGAIEHRGVAARVYQRSGP